MVVINLLTLIITIMVSAVVIFCILLWLDSSSKAKAYKVAYDTVDSLDYDELFHKRVLHLLYGVGLHHKHSDSFTKGAVAAWIKKFNECGGK